jgi:hypothetical protein
MLRTTSESAESKDQLQSFIEKFESQQRAVIRAARKKLRKRFPTATQRLAVESLWSVRYQRSSDLAANQEKPNRALRLTTRAALWIYAGFIR